MKESKVTSNGQTTLTRSLRAAQKFDAGDRLHHVVSSGEVCILKAHPVVELSRGIVGLGSGSLAFLQIPSK